MLCSLAVSDLLVGFLVQPIYVAKEVTKEPLLYYLSDMFAFAVCIVSLLTIMAITVDRFLALHYHMRYATLVTKSRVKYALLFPWLMSFFGSGFQFWNRGLHHILTGVVIVICLVASIFFYVRIYFIVRRHQLQIHAQQQAVQSFNAENNLNMVRLKKSAMNTFVFYIALIICYFPMFVALTLYGISDKYRRPGWAFSATVVFMNSSINPFLYCWRLRELRTAVVKTARQMLCKQTEEN